MKRGFTMLFSVLLNVLLTPTDLADAVLSEELEGTVPARNQVFFPPQQIVHTSQVYLLFQICKSE